LPRKVFKPCLYHGCINTVQYGYCQTHAHFYNPPQRAIEVNRPSAAARGYNKEWQAIRVEVLRKHGVPKELWHLYDIHHDPPYNPKKEPNHRKYNLIPMIHNHHSRETARSRGKGDKSLQPQVETGKAKANNHTTKIAQGVICGSR